MSVVLVAWSNWHIPCCKFAPSPGARGNHVRIQWSEMIAPSAAAVVGTVLLTLWLSGSGEGNVELRVPGLDKVPDDAPTTVAEGPVVASEPVAGDGVASSVAGQWPSFRGTNRDAICQDDTPLARTWPASGPPSLWTVDLGEGYAGAAVSDGRVYVLDYDEEAVADTMRCLSLDDGLTIWTNRYPVLVTRNHGMSRTVPAIAGDCVISIGPRGHVACWSADSGECRWLIDLVREHGATVPRWYVGQCPLIDEDRLLLAPCGPSMLIAVDYRTGEVIWESPNPRGWQMTHVSIMPMQLGDRKCYLYCGSGGIAAVAADDGSLLWDSTEWPQQFASCPSPLVLPGERIFLCSGYGRTTGSLLLQVRKSDDGFSAEPAVRLTPKQFNSEQQTPILFGDRIYGVRKSGGGQLVCLDLEGNELWNSGSDRFGHGPYLIADGLIFVMDDKGRLTTAEATPDGYQKIAHCEVFAEGHDAWGPMALVAGRLIVRDMTRMTCLDASEAINQK